MAVKISNTLSSFLEETMVNEVNSLSILEGINQAMIDGTTKDHIDIAITDPNNPDIQKNYQIPTFGYLKRSIERIDGTLRTIMNVDGNRESYIGRTKLPDGTYRKIVATTLPCEAPDITTLNDIDTFKTKSNHFFEDLMNPLVCVSLDLTDKVPKLTRKILIQRYILDLKNDPAKISVFNSLKDKSGELDYLTFCNEIIKGTINYYALDEEIKDIPPREKIYSGTFTIATDGIEPVNNYYGTTRIQYTFTGTGELQYWNNKTGQYEPLTEGDYLEKNTYPVYVKYKVIEISGRSVVLETVEGVGILRPGDELRISAEQETPIIMDIPVGIDEYNVIFVKAIDPISNIPSDNWSCGVVFFTNDLTATIDNKEVTLKQYYENEVSDYGEKILSYANDYIPTVRYAVKPDAPKLDMSNFYITQINGHLTENVDVDSILALVSEKTKISSEIDSLTNQIIEMQKDLDTIEFSTDKEKEDYEDRYKGLVEKQTILYENYKALVMEIDVKTTNLSTSSPKFRVRGFWDMPNPKIDAHTGSQEVIKFKIRYRYLNSNNEYPQEQRMTFKTKSGSITNCLFSDWIEIEGKTRKRIKGEDGIWYWEPIDAEYMRRDEVKINQCDIPINDGERVEIQVSSISEAGWPSNPVESDWSTSLNIGFSDGHVTKSISEELKELIAQNKVDMRIIRTVKI